MIPKATRRVHETTIRAGVAGIAGGFTFSTNSLAFALYLAGVAAMCFWPWCPPGALAIDPPRKLNC
ncbi:hypothetical protein RW1_041_00960 [Rhodococcus wratislaviensis NBRC 100605]|uniref:Uncharacterized protein n=1 Tax=Rhodococcus wratislaviensis NBRC 100605 TaxID=1219028 RepID=X0Q7Y1_RHOWR|nr:hypothetical protein RW1_041_00960 [Rhodococcus wratislaviensis NBRC 100605]